MEALLLVIDLFLMIVFIRGIGRAEASNDPEASLGFFAYKPEKSEDAKPDRRGL